MKHYAVTVEYGGERMTSTFPAATPGKARAAAARSMIGAGLVNSFKEFLGHCRSVRQEVAPSNEGYAYIERYYGKVFRIGDRVRLNKGEGSSAGLEGEVVYPGRSTAHVKVVIDGRDHAVSVHPHGVDVISSPERTDA